MAFIVNRRDRGEMTWTEDSRYEQRHLADAQAQRWVDAGRESEVIEDASVPATPAAQTPEQELAALRAENAKLRADAEALAKDAGTPSGEAPGPVGSGQ